MTVYKSQTGDDVKRTANSIANEIERNMARWKFWADSMNTIPAGDLTALGVDADWQTQIGSMRTDVVALVAWYTANASVFVKRLAQLTVF